MISLYIEAVIDENYRDFFNKIYYGERCELCTECLKGMRACSSLKTLKADSRCDKCEEAFYKKTHRKFENLSHAKYWHYPACIFKRNIIRSSASGYYYDIKYKNSMGYDKETGKLLIIAYIHSVGRNKVEYFIQDCILPFGNIIKYKSYDDEIEIDNLQTKYHHSSKYKEECIEKYQYILDELDCESEWP